MRGIIMDTVIQFTPAQIIVIAGAIITLSTACGVIVNLISKLKEPEKKQDDRIKALEDRADKFDGIIEKFQGYFSNDDRRFKEIENGNRITQTALLALLKHSLNGNDTKALREAEKSLEEYLINK
jgi:hypothetical protein